MKYNAMEQCSLETHVLAENYIVSKFSKLTTIQ